MAGLHLAVHDTAAVDVRQGSRDVSAEPGRGGPSQRTGRDAVGERRPVHQRHDAERAVAVRAHVEQLDQARVTQPGQDLGVRVAHRAPVGAREHVAEDLDRDPAAVALVDRRMDVGHAAAAQQGAQALAVGQQGRGHAGGGSHRRPRGRGSRRVKAARAGGGQPRARPTAE